MPIRVQLRRSKGWRKPETAVVVARPSCWGNPHRATAPTAEAHRAAVDAFRADLLADALPYGAADVRRALRGRDLACWCRDDLPCHADVLLEVANGE
ncbi:MAG TPA: DUF4326 domain-containing protein [Nocardioides sp.]|nr:DUF4326 domain-containing protein [Nocardioides sp.]